MRDIARRSAFRVAGVMLFAAASAGGLVLFGAAGSGSSTGAEGDDIAEIISGFEETLPVSDSGRILQYAIVNAISVDEETGRPTGGGRSFLNSCEFDAYVRLSDGRVSSVRASGDATSVEAGERVLGDEAELAYRGDGEVKVYRDDSGDLRLGCDPDTWAEASFE